MIDHKPSPKELADHKQAIEDRQEAAKRWAEEYAKDHPAGMAKDAKGKALLVLLLDPNIYTWLAEHEPTATRQAQEAMTPNRSYCDYLPRPLAQAHNVADAERAMIENLDFDLKTLRVARRSRRLYDLSLRGKVNGYPTSAWLVLAAIRRLTPWTSPEIANNTSYPEMTRSGDWSGVRDSDEAQLWYIFDNFVLKKK